MGEAVWNQTLSVGATNVSISAFEVGRVGMLKSYR